MRRVTGTKMLGCSSDQYLRSSENCFQIPDWQVKYVNDSIRRACVWGQATSSRDHQASQGGAWGWLLWAPAQQQPEGQRGVQWVKFGVIWHVMWHVICNSIIWYAIYHHIAWWLYDMLYVIMTYNMSYNMSYNITHTQFDIHWVLQWFFFDFMIDLLSLFSEMDAYSWKYLAKFSWNQTKTALYQRVHWEIQTKCWS